MLWELRGRSYSTSHLTIPFMSSEGTIVSVGVDWLFSLFQGSSLTLAYMDTFTADGHVVNEVVLGGQI